MQTLCHYNISPPITIRLTWGLKVWLRQNLVLLILLFNFFYSIITMLANAMHIFSTIEILMPQTKVKSTLLILITMITMITLQN